jgi:uncharacterized protein
MLSPRLRIENTAAAAASARHASDAEASSAMAPTLPQFLPMNPLDLEQLVSREMPFGKYKGRCIADLPGNYLAWFARAGFPAGEIGRLLALMHEIDHNGLKDMLAPLRQRGR